MRMARCGAGLAAVDEAAQECVVECGCAPPAMAEPVREQIKQPVHGRADRGRDRGNEWSASGRFPLPVSPRSMARIPPLFSRPVSWRAASRVPWLPTPVCRPPTRATSLRKTRPGLVVSRA